MKKKIILILLICFSVLLVKSKIVYAAGTCGTCGQKYKYEYTSTGKGYHGVRQGCVCGSSTGTEDCSGGTATCTSQAKCSKCGAAYGNAKGHSFTSKSTTSTYLKSGATCTSAAVYYYKCSRCTAKDTSTYTSGSALGHTIGTTIVGYKNIASNIHAPEYECKNGCGLIMTRWYY